MDNQRLAYPDICKFLAIFLVTCSHCAQSISGVNYTNFLGGNQIDIAFNMPLFMLISGWFLNPEKIRKENISKFILNKAKRLIVPALTWYLIFCLTTFHSPAIFESIRFYWYLTALFFSYCIIISTIKLIKNDALCAIISTLFVIACPITFFAHTNFMFPFIWAGFYIRKLLNSNKAEMTFITSCIIGLPLLFFWNKEYTVYRSPLNTMHLNLTMIIAYIYRLTIGLCLSIIFVYIIKKNEKKKFLSGISRFGVHTLVIYISSTVFVEILKITLEHLNYHTNEYFVLDVLSILSSIIIVVFSFVIYKVAKKNSITSLLFLGESK